MWCRYWRHHWETTPPKPAWTPTSISYYFNLRNQVTLFINQTRVSYTSCIVAHTRVYFVHYIPFEVLKSRRTRFIPEARLDLMRPGVTRSPMTWRGAVKAANRNVTRWSAWTLESMCGWRPANLLDGKCCRLFPRSHNPVILLLYFVYFHCFISFLYCFSLYFKSTSPLFYVKPQHIM